MSAGNRPARPEPGSWYHDPVGRRFEVASVDPESGVIQVVYDDGEAAEMDLADWRHAMIDHDALPEERVEPPVDDWER